MSETDWDKVERVIAVWLRTSVIGVGYTREHYYGHANELVEQLKRVDPDGERMDQRENMHEVQQSDNKVCMPVMESDCEACQTDTTHAKEVTRKRPTLAETRTGLDFCPVCKEEAGTDRFEQFGVERCAVCGATLEQACNGACGCRPGVGRCVRLSESIATYEKMAVKAALQDVIRTCYAYAEEADAKATVVGSKLRWEGRASAYERIAYELTKIIEHKA